MTWAIKAYAKAGGAELEIYDVIGASLFGGITAKDVRAALQGKEGDLTVRLNSAGGSVTEGLAIYNAISEYPGKVTTRVDALAASIASVIALAGDEVEIADNAYFMIHNPFAQIEGGSKDLRQMADLLDTMRETTIGIYAEATKQPREAIEKALDNETWFTADEAQKFGLATKVVPSGKRRSVALNQLNLGLLQGLKAVPKALSQDSIKMEEELATLRQELDKLRADFKTSCEENEKLKAKIAKAKDAKAEDDSDKDDDSDNDSDADAKARVIAVAMQATGVSDIEALEGALMALSVKAKSGGSAKTAHVEAVTKAITEGKLIPAQKTWALGTTPKAFASYLKSLGDTQVHPVGVEHQPDEPKARAHSKTDPASIQLTAEEEDACKRMGVSPAMLLEDKRKRFAASVS